MKLLKRSALLLFALAAFTTSKAQTQKTDTLKVWGNCGMCKKRIETAIKSDVLSANWNKDTKLLVVTYDSAKTNKSKMQQVIAAAGHDTEGIKASEKAYQKLHTCCQYERPENAASGQEGRALH